MNKYTKRNLKNIFIAIFLLSFHLIIILLIINRAEEFAKKQLQEQRMAIVFEEADNLSKLYGKVNESNIKNGNEIYETEYFKHFLSKYANFIFADESFLSIISEEGLILCNNKYIDSLNFKKKAFTQISKKKNASLKYNQISKSLNEALVIHYRYYKPWKCYFLINYKDNWFESKDKTFLLWILIFVFIVLFVFACIVILHAHNIIKKHANNFNIHLNELMNGSTLNEKMLLSGCLDEATKSMLLELSNNYSEKVDFVHRLSEGVIDELSLNFKKSDELGKNLTSLHQYMLKSRIESQAKALEDEKRNWTTRGIADFSEVLRKNHENINDFAFDIIKFIVKYLKINQGGIFILNDANNNDKFLELSACWAYDRRKYLEKRIEIGEGLVGSCFLEMNTFYLTKLPENYTQITSGLGGATAKALLIIPLKYEEKAYGVLELASLKPFENYVIQFVEKIAESIALSISGVKNKEITQALLEQSELQREDLRNKEEEMLQNMEELTATQEEMAKKTSEMESTIAAIDETIGAVEFKSDGTIIKANNLFLEKLKIKQEELVFKKFTDFFNFYLTESTNAVYWNDLLNGIIVKREAKYKFPNSNIKWFQETYNPIQDKDGTIIKILAGYIDITDLKQAKIEMDNTFKAIDSTFAEIELGLDGKIVFVNEFMLNLIKQSKESLIGKFHIDVLAKDVDDDKSYELLWEQLKRGEIVYSKRKYRFSEEKTFWFSETFCPLRDINNQISSIFIGLRDITDLVESQRLNLELTSTLNSHLSLENLISPLMEFSINGDVIYINDKLLALLGYSKDEWNNQTTIINKEYFETEIFFKELMELKSGKVINTNLSLIKRNGELMHIQAYEKAIILNNDNIKSIIALIQL